MTYPLLEADTQSLRYKFSYLCAKSGRFVDAIGVHGKAILAYTLHGNDVERNSTYGSFEYLTLRWWCISDHTVTKASKNAVCSAQTAFLMAFTGKTAL